MTTARIHPFCKKHDINIGCYDGFRVSPRSFTDRNIALHMYKNHFCLIWETQGVCFKKATEELKTNFRVVDNVMSDKDIKSFFEDEYKPKKLQPQLTNRIVYDI